MSNNVTLKKLFSCFLPVVTLVQTVFAVIWLSGNIGLYREEFLTNNYIEAAKTLVVDDWMGIGYALIVKLFGSGWILYIIQLALVFLSVAFVAGGFNRDHCLLAAFVTSNPLVLQACCSVMPHALLLAFTLLMIGFYRRWNVIGIILVCVILGFLNPDYAFILLFASIPIEIVSLIRKKGEALPFVIGVSLALLLCIGVNRQVTDVAAYGGVEKSFNFLMMQRLSYGHVSESSGITSTYYGKNFYWEMLGGDRTPENLGLEFGRKFEDYAGKTSAEAVYKYIYEVALSKGPASYLPPILRDFSYYVFTPLSVEFIYLTGKTETLISNPLYLFLSGDFNLYKVYIGFSALSMVIIMALTLAMAIQMIVTHKFSGNKVMIISLAYVALCMCIYATFACTAGFDYRNSLFMTAFYPLLTFYLFEGKEEK